MQATEETIEVSRMPSSAASVPTANAANGASSGSGSTGNTTPDAVQTNAAANFPPPKTDKPRPHVCGTCGRSFARLEHLKRHERSHTKEKPFECPQCTRCFARRDLLLRHQQKLHQAGATSARPRNGRRESTSGMSVTGRGRKNSMSGSMNGASGVGAASMRPRANTISHIDGAALNNLMSAAGTSISRNGGIHTGHSHHPSLTNLSNPHAFEFSSLAGSMGHHGMPHALPKIDTRLGLGLGGGLRTAPLQGFADHFEMDKLYSSASTINPAQLHFPQSLGTPASPFQQLFGGTLEEDDSFDWANGMDNNGMLMNGVTDAALDESSPSAISTASQSGFSEVMLDGSNNPAQTSTGIWHTPLSTQPMVNQSPFNIDTLGPVFPELLNPLSTVSPNELHDTSAGADFYLSSPQPLGAISPTIGMAGIQGQYFQPPMTFGSDSNSISSTSMSSSARHSSVTSSSTDSITDATRQTLLLHLSQALSSGSGQRKYSQPLVSSPLSTSGSTKSSTSQPVSLPSTPDLQRYVQAYIQYFHLHLPFLHIPTLSFESPTYTNHLRTGGNQHASTSSTSTSASITNESIVGGGGCLILSMASIGALYEHERTVAKELFDSAKKMILFYLEERRRAGLNAVVNGSSRSSQDSANQTPLWLVQAMLLNLTYGHISGDKQATEVATTHCAALVSLARAADLDKPAAESVKGASAAAAAAAASQGNNNSSSGTSTSNNIGVHMTEDGDFDMIDEVQSPTNLDQQQQQQQQQQKGAAASQQDDLHARWIEWKTREERKRTFFAVFFYTCTLVTAYARPPGILNSEVRLELPCEEDLWSAENAHNWAAISRVESSQRQPISFSEALAFLLGASQRQQREDPGHHPYAANFGLGSSFMDTSDSNELKPSSFGCIILINALHVYIWETRQRHSSRHWKAHETAAMHAQIEPALKAWQAAWAANPRHTLERANTFGPLGPDCIPLLDLAYVRLYVDLGRLKDAFWNRDFEAMAAELARGREVTHSSEDSPDSSDFSDPSKAATMTTNSPGMVAPTRETDTGMDSQQQSGTSGTIHSSKREKRLRKVAFYAADSLLMSGRLGVTFSDYTPRDLPIQYAMCMFDCTQVLAEWVATVQDRVGRYLGILGKVPIDYSQVPAIVLLEEEDIKLFEKISDIISNADLKITLDMNRMANSSALTTWEGLGTLADYGYGGKLLIVASRMLENAAVWPIANVMARALEVHATHLNQRAEASVSG